MFLHPAAQELAADGDLGARPSVVLVAGRWDPSDPEGYAFWGQPAEGRRTPQQQRDSRPS